MTVFYGRHAKEWQALVDQLGGTAEVAGKHAKITFPNGAVYFCPLTPSDRRGILNARADMEKLAGRKIPRQKSGKTRHKPPQGAQFINTKPTAPNERTDNLLKKKQRLDSIDRTISQWLATGGHGIDQKKAERLLEERYLLARALHRSGMSVNLTYMEKP